MPRKKVDTAKLTCPKGWYTAKQDVKNNSTTPDIDFWAIISFENLWSHVIRTTNNLRKELT